MENNFDNGARIQPDLIRRTGGGWLAISPKSAPIAIGVTADTDSNAIEKFRSVYRRWQEILSENT